jgi:putative transposase
MKSASSRGTIAGDLSADIQRRIMWGKTTAEEIGESFRICSHKFCERGLSAYSRQGNARIGESSSRSPLEIPHRCLVIKPPMQKTVAAKLIPSKTQAQALKATLAVFADACNQALKVAQNNNVKRAFDIHRLCYRDIKAATGLTSNYVVRAIGRLAQSFGKKKPPKEFKPTSLDLDKDLIRFIPLYETVSIATVEGRQKIKLQLGNYQRHLLKRQKPTAGHLVYDKKKKAFYIHFVIDVPERPESDPDDALGVDLGINRIATVSTGEIFSGRDLNRLRELRQRTRSSLQAKGTQGCKRALKRLSGKQARMMEDVNHVISKKIVAKAKSANIAIALEDLTGIRERAGKGKRMRKMLGRWAFYDLRTKIAYKAKQAGVTVVYVDPAYTSKTCSACGEIGSRRKHKFVCKSCGNSMDADHNGAVNISRRGRQALRSRNAVKGALSGGTRYRPASRRLIGDGS